MTEVRYGTLRLKPADTVKDSFICPHCRDVLLDAVQNEDGDRLCHKCCNAIAGMPSRCTDCGVSVTPESQVYPDRAARKEIRALKFYCLYFDFGCSVIDVLRVLEDHVMNCPFKGVNCPHKGCEVCIRAKELETHIKECVYREVSCEYCDTALAFCKLVPHYEQDCLEYPLPCHQCGEPVSRKNMQQHMEDTCKLIHCAICRKLVNRETTQEQADSQNEAVHLSNPKTTFEHLQSIAKKTECIAREQTTLSIDIQELKENSVPFNKFIELEKRVGSAVTVVDTLKTTKEDDGIIGLKTLVQEIQRTATSQNKKIERQARDIDKLTFQLAAQTNALAVVKGHTRLEHEEYTMTSGQSTRNYLTSEPSNVEGRLMQMAKSVEELQRTTSMMKVHISELELQLQASLASTHTGSFLWRIPEIARRKRDAIDGRITSIYSPPFYSGQNGYKMCIRVYLNGDGVGFNTHLSVFFVLMQGEYDPLLKWPFENKVSLILVDQNLRQHIVQTFKPSPESSSFRKPRSEMNVASGCPQFAKLSVLNEGNYVKSDVLFLKCITDTTKISHP